MRNWELGTISQRHRTQTFASEFSLTSSEFIDTPLSLFDSWEESESAGGAGADFYLEDEGDGNRKLGNIEHLHKYAIMN